MSLKDADADVIYDMRRMMRERVPLSFRDQCAIAAMQGMMANPNQEIVPADESGVVKWAFSIADAMCAERLKRGYETYAQGANP